MAAPQTEEVQVDDSRNTYMSLVILTTIALLACGIIGFLHTDQIKQTPVTTTSPFG